MLNRNKKGRQMTTNEQNTITKLLEIVQQLKIENNKFKELIASHVDSLEVRIDKKLAPISMEQDILSTIQQSIGAAIKSSLSGYNNPLDLLIRNVVNSYSSELTGIISDAFGKTIKTEGFKATLIDEFGHKVARLMVNTGEGLFEKVFSQLKQNPEFKARVTLMLSGIVGEFLGGIKED
jgi:hypothetical protein